MLHRRSVLFSLVVSGLCCLPALQAGTIVIPGADAGTEGDTNNGFPFDITAFSLSSQRYQQAYAASGFSGPILITGIDFRPDAFTGAAFSSTLPSIQIDLSTTSAAVDALSLTFASNVGGDDTIVYASGPLALSSAFTGPVGGPKAFDIHIAFTTPFVYNPLNGNLLLDVRNFGGGTTTPFDSDDASGAISRVSTTTSGVGSATADFSDTQGLVTQFDFGSAVPEPSTGFLVGGALMGLLLVGRRVRR
jgi:hypothetical protein